MNGSRVNLSWASFLPHGGRLSREAIEDMAKQTREAIEHARGLGEREMQLTAAAATDFWETIDDPLTNLPPTDMGAMLARGAPNVKKLALIYALLDRRPDRRGASAGGVCGLAILQDLSRAAFRSGAGGPASEPRYSPSSTRLAQRVCPDPLSTTSSRGESFRPSLRQF